MSIDDYEQISKTLKVLRLQRVFHLAAFAGVVVLLLVLGYLLWGEIDTEAIVVGFVLCVIFAFFVTSKNFSYKYKALFIEKFVENSPVPLVYSKTGYFSDTMVEDLPLWVSFSPCYGMVTYSAKAEDKFNMDINGRECYFQEVDMKRVEKEDDQTTTYPLFRGLFLETPNVHNLGFRLVVYSPGCPMTNEGSELPTVKMEDSKLLPGLEDHKFASDRPESCAAYLQQHVEFQQRICDVLGVISDKLADEHYAFVFEEQVVYVFILSNFDRFEASLFRSVKYANVDDDYSSIMGMVDIAKVMLA